MWHKTFCKFLNKHILAYPLILACIIAYPNESIANDVLLTCEQFQEIVADGNELDSYGILPRQLEIMSKKCPNTTGKLASILKRFFEYHRVMMERDFPNSMVRLPDTDFNKIYENDLNKINYLLGKIENENLKDVTGVLRFMTKQKEDGYTYAWTALEIVARDFPGSYESYKKLTVVGTEGRRAWEVNKNRWLKK